jgi:hypothetical protein
MRGRPRSAGSKFHDDHVGTAEVALCHPSRALTPMSRRFARPIGAATPIRVEFAASSALAPEVH